MVATFNDRWRYVHSMHLFILIYFPCWFYLFLLMFRKYLLFSEHWKLNEDKEMRYSHLHTDCLQNCYSVGLQADSLRLQERWPLFAYGDKHVRTMIDDMI